MAEVDRQIYLVWLRYLELILLVLHEDGDELIANLWGVLGVVGEAILLSVHHLLKGRILFRLEALALDFLGPSDFVQAFSEEDGVHDNCFVEDIVDLQRDSVQVIGEDFVDMHVLSFAVREVIVISLPVFPSILFFVFLFGRLC
jgi:hypothetical protein